MLTYSNIGHNNGKTEVVVYWIDIQMGNSVKSVNLPINISGTICDLEIANADNFFQYDVTSNQVIIKKSSSTPFSLAGGYSPLLTLRFGSVENGLVTIQGAFQNHILTASNEFFMVDVSVEKKFTPTQYNVSGFVQKPESNGAQCTGGINNGVPGVRLDYSPVAGCVPGLPTFDISVDGTYSKNLREQLSYKVKASKNSGCSCGIEEYDINKIRQFILTGGEPPVYAFDKLYKWLAADFDGNGNILTLDILHMQNCKLGIFSPPTPGWESWICIPVNIYNDYQNTYPPPYADYYPPQFLNHRTIPTLTQSVIFQDFYCFKRGDIDQSCTDCNGTNFQNNDPNDRSVVSTFIKVPETQVGAGEIIDIPILGDFNGDVSVFGLELEIDPNYLEVLEYSGPESDISNEFVSVSGDRNEKITALWIGMQPASIGEQLFSIKCRVLKNSPSLQKLIKQNKNELQNLVIYEDGHFKKIKMSEFYGTTISDFDANFATVSSTADPLILNYTISADSEVDVRIWNMNGQEYSIQNLELKSGTDNAELELYLPDSGMYFYSINAPNRTISGKLIKL